jgi:hypothetical protein
LDAGTDAERAWREGGTTMADMHHVVAADGVDVALAYAALTTQDGIAGWWTSRAGRHRRPRRGPAVDEDDMFRIVTVGWSQMLLSPKEYPGTGVRKPLVDF